MLIHTSSSTSLSASTSSLEVWLSNVNEREDSNEEEEDDDEEKEAKQQQQEERITMSSMEEINILSICIMAHKWGK